MSKLFNSYASQWDIQPSALRFLFAGKDIDIESTVELGMKVRYSRTGYRGNHGGGERGGSFD